MILHVHAARLRTLSAASLIALATAAALVLAAVWLYGFWRRLATGALIVQRPDRERRGF